MAKYNVGIIGYGWAATAHIDAINACPDAEVVAIYSSRSLDADELKQRYGSDITPYRDVKKLIADGAIGTLLEFRGRGKEDRRGGGEDLWVLGSHVLDMIRALHEPPIDYEALEAAARK